MQLQKGKYVLTNINNRQRPVSRHRQDEHLNIQAKLDLNEHYGLTREDEIWDDAMKLRRGTAQRVQLLYWSRGDCCAAQKEQRQETLFWVVQIQQGVTARSCL